MNQKFFPEDSTHIPLYAIDTHALRTEIRDYNQISKQLREIEINRLITMIQSVIKILREHSITVKIFITCLFFAILFYKINFIDILQTFLVINPGYFILSLAIVPILYIIRAHVWKLLLLNVGINENIFHLLKILLIGVFYGLITPGKIGEFGRIIHLDHPKVQVAPTVIVEKILDVVGLLSICFVISLIIFRSRFEFISMVFIFSIFLIFAIFIISNEKFILSIGNFLNMEHEKIDSYLNFLRSSYNNKKIITICFFYTLLYYFFALVIGFFLALSLNIDTIVVFTIPLMILVGNIPITIGGLGLRESIGALTFELLGLTAAYGVTYSLLRFIVIVVIPGFFGYYYSMKWKGEGI
ncbi:MAG: flippase-like domain-containing protein [Candidatus Methanofastidiosa archaeon]|nr:flippase-like domain-containing protein [Candidatus Methanofastidiosa archaeon]